MHHYLEGSWEGLRGWSTKHNAGFHQARPHGYFVLFMRHSIQLFIANLNSDTLNAVQVCVGWLMGCFWLDIFGLYGMLCIGLALWAIKTAVVSPWAQISLHVQHNRNTVIEHQLERSKHVFMRSHLTACFKSSVLVLFVFLCKWRDSSLTLLCNPAANELPSLDSSILIVRPISGTSCAVSVLCLCGCLHIRLHINGLLTCY